MEPNHVPVCAGANGGASTQRPPHALAERRPAKGREFVCLALARCPEYGTQASQGRPWGFWLAIYPLLCYRLTSSRIPRCYASQSVSQSAHHVRGPPQSCLCCLWSPARPVQSQLMRHAPAKWAEDKTPSRLFPVCPRSVDGWQVLERDLPCARVQADRLPEIRQPDGCDSLPFQPRPSQPAASQPAPSFPISCWVVGGVSLSPRRLTVCRFACVPWHPWITQLLDLLFLLPC